MEFLLPRIKSVGAFRQIIMNDPAKLEPRDSTPSKTNP
jgi:hypothetical protein